MFVSRPNFDYQFDESKCADCGGNCCSGKSGYIWVDEQEQKNIAQFINIEYEEFRKDYLRVHCGRYSIKELKISGNYNCVFFDIEKKCCSIYEVRPKQCREFPFWEYYRTRCEELVKECPGIITNQ